jgi:hypothetical protein
MVMVLNDAMKFIEEKVARAAGAHSPIENDVPLLAWTRRAYFNDNAGNRTEYGPHFVFSWTNAETIDQYGYFTLTTANGGRLAFAPGDFFRSKPRNIVREGNTIVPAPSD